MWDVGHEMYFSVIFGVGVCCFVHYAVVLFAMHSEEFSVTTGAVTSNNQIFKPARLQIHNCFPHKRMKFLCFYTLCREVCIWKFQTCEDTFYHET